VEVDDLSITYVPRNGEPLRMEWKDIRRVVARELLGRLELYDFANRRMRLDYQIEGFSILQMLLQEDLQDVLGGMARQTIFKKSAIYFASWFIPTAFLLVPVWAGLKSGKWELALLFSLIIVMLLFLLSMESCSVRIAETGIEVRYPLRKRVLKFREIRYIEMKDLPGRGGTIPGVVISLDGNASVNLTRYRDGHLVLCHALRSAREKATEQPRVT
jgi:hypothetical protein